MSEALLQIENLYKAYGEKVILDDIDFSLRKGEFCSLVGPSGCGKSTLLRLILGQEQPTRAEKFTIAGEPVGPPDTRRGIVYQRYSLFPNRTVIQNVMMGLELDSGILEKRKNRHAHKQEALDFLNNVGLSGDEDKYPHELSGGMRQRVAIAQALIMKPEIILMDEPFGALDPGTREDMQIFLLQLWEKFQMTIVFVTHDLEEAVFLGTRIVALSQYYDDSRDEDIEDRGAKIVCDYPLPAVALSTMVKTKPNFGELIQQIRKEGFDPEYRQQVTQFNLDHPDSFQTLDKSGG